MRRVRGLALVALVAVLLGGCINPSPPRGGPSGAGATDAPHSAADMAPRGEVSFDGRPGLAGTAPSGPELVVASDLENPPFALVGVDGLPRGRDVEMMVALGRLLDRPLRWQRMPFDQLLGAVERGRVHVVCATLGITPERAQRVAFTRPYFETRIAAVVRAGPGEPRSLDELAGRKVSAGVGTTSERAVRRRLPTADLRLGDKSELSTLERLVLGELDAAVMDGPNADALVASAGGALVVIAEPLETERYALALPRSETALRDELDRALTELEQRGVLRSLDQVYGLAPTR